MGKEYNSERKPILPGDDGYVLEDDGAIWFNEYTMVRTKNGGIESSAPRKKSRAAPPVVDDTQLDILIGNYIYTYVDKPSAMTIHATQALSALLELKKLRKEKMPNVAIDDHVTAQRLEIERLRAALQSIAKDEDQARESVTKGFHNTTFAIDLAGRARMALEQT